ncbi:MAG: type III pantothenate kinase [Gammaproteobacteria bacterium]|jgi:type III pantothenate kinase
MLSMPGRSLLVDIGNSRIKWMLADADGNTQPESIAHGGRLPPALEKRWQSIAPPQHVLVSCVAHADIVSALETLASRLWGSDVRRLVATREHGGLVNCYDHPERLGVDRWLAMSGAHAMAEGAFCVVDAGTAMTIDVVGPGGRHQGGLIVPGLSMMIESLRAGTAMPDYAGKASPALLGCSTENAIRLGCLRALGALVDRVIADSELDSPRLLVTGGDATRVMPFIDSPCEHVPDLVFLGMRGAMQPK